MSNENVTLKPCRSPYCECDQGACTHPGFYDARGEPVPEPQPSEEKCMVCNGTGLDLIDRETCMVCGGTGKDGVGEVVAPRRQRSNVIDPYEECAQCEKFHYTHADEKHAFVRKPTAGVPASGGGQQ